MVEFDFMSSPAKAKEPTQQSRTGEQLQWISLEAKVVKKHTWSKLRKNATC